MKYYIGISHCPSGPTGMYRRQVHVEYRPPLLHPLLLWYSKWVTALVVDVSNHLLPAVIWCLRNYQFITLWNQYKYDDPVGQLLGIHGILIQRHFLPLLLLVLDTTHFPSNLNKYSLVYGFSWPLSTLLYSNRLNPSHTQAATTVFSKYHWLVLSNKTFRWAGKNLGPLSQTFFGSSNWKSLEQSSANCLETRCKILFHWFPAPKRLFLLKCLNTDIFWCNCGKREDFFHMCTSGQGVFNEDMKCTAVIIIQ